MATLHTEVLRQYNVKSMIGNGAYGSVWEAIDKISRESVAIKHCLGVRKRARDTQKMYREVVILLRLKHAAVVSLYDVILPEDSLDAFLIFELAEMDLARYLRAHPIDFNQRVSLTVQLFAGLDYLHSANICHRDLKPENVLVYARGTHLKIADFGLARDVPHDLDAPLSTAVITIWYRPPELLLGATRYSYEVDIWSAGCVAAFIFSGKPLIRGGTPLEMLQATVTVLGPPSAFDIQTLPTVPDSSPLSNWHIPSPSAPNGILPKLFPEKPVYEFLRNILQYSPPQRPTAHQILQSPFFSGCCIPAAPLPEPVDLPAKLQTVDFYCDGLREEVARLKHRREGVHVASGEQNKQGGELNHDMPLQSLGNIGIIPNVPIHISVEQNDTFMVLGPPSISASCDGEAVVGILSHPQEITLLHTAREALSIPPQATTFAFCYPVVDLHFLGGPSKEPCRSFVEFGGFVYFAPDRSVVQYNALTSGAGISFVGPHFLPTAVREKLFKENRMQPITFPDLKAKGALRFGWLYPGEDKVLGLAAPLPYGGFMYDFDKPGWDCNFSMA
eukprot:TRINITY_DN25284_c0_g1_i1.p1 TRINITY_DN25284_c0_g1~~TRINITY_DN25284_c0_g1_i1.p1  ORF type:complete len:560 (+),score=72.29 TRINITY_DN25284_c0_g1_i1:47-1726(+)